MILIELKETYAPYNDFWEEWSSYEENDLSSVEVYIIEVYRRRDFILSKPMIHLSDIDLNIMNYLLSPISRKLIKNYDRYVDWVVNNFYFYLIDLSRKTDLDMFFSTPIINLTLDEKLRNKLKEIGYKTLDDLINENSHPNDRRKLFDTALNFKEEIKVRINEIKERHISFDATKNYLKGGDWRKA